MSQTQYYHFSYNIKSEIAKIKGYNTNNLKNNKKYKKILIVEDTSFENSFLRAEEYIKNRELFCGDISSYELILTLIEDIKTKRTL